MMQNFSVKERRKSARKWNSLPVLINLKDKPWRIPRKISAVTINTSRHGLLLHLPEKNIIGVGDAVSIEIIDTDTEQYIPTILNLVIDATIVRIDKEGVAVSFKSLSSGIV